MQYFRLRETLAAAINISFCMAELYCFYELIPDIILQSYLATINMPFLFHNQFKKTPIVTNIFRIDDISIRKLSYKLEIIFKTVGYSPDNVVYKALWITHGIAPNQRIIDLQNQLARNLQLLLAYRKELVNSRRPPLWRSISSLKSFNPTKKISESLEDFRSQVPDFRSSFQEETSNAFSYAKLTIAVRGIYVSISTFLLGVVLNARNDLYSFILTFTSNLSIFWPLLALLGGTILAGLVGGLEFVILLKFSNRFIVPSKIQRILTMLRKLH